MRQLQRGQMLREERSRRGETSVIVKGCENCGLAIGQCGCGGGPQVALAMAPGTIQGDYGPSGPVAGGGNLASNPPGGPNGGGGWGDGMKLNPGCWPLGLQRRPKMYAEALREHMWRKCPYVDPMYDWMNMDVIYSDITTIAAGITTPVNVSPAAGTFAAFYYNIIVVDETTQVQQVDWRFTRPRVDGCPIPCDVGTEDAVLAQFGMRVPEACCGYPLAAWLDRRSEDVPLTTDVTNNQGAGNILVQIEVRGYCCSTRIC